MGEESESSTLYGIATTEKAKETSNVQFMSPKGANQIGNYQFEKNIGEGNFAKVKLAVHVITREKVAVKIIDKAKLDQTSAKKLFREVRIMKLLRHPHIVRLYEVIDTPKELYIIMEYAQRGEIFDYLVAHGRLKEKDARKYFRQIVSAIDYCHQLHVVHRDLKAENIMIDKDMQMKIADFGFSNQFTPGSKLNTWCGSPPYAAPELFQGKEYTGPEVDIWSLGVVLYVLVCGCLPFDGSTLQKLRARVLAGKFKIPFYMSTDCERLVKKCLLIDTTKRATMEDIKNDPWFNEECQGELLNPPLAKLTPAEEDIVFNDIESLGYDIAAVKKSLEENAYDHLSAIYYLCAEKFQRKDEADKPKPKPRRVESGIASIPEDGAAVTFKEVPAAISGATAKKRANTVAQAPPVAALVTPAPFSEEKKEEPKKTTQNTAEVLGTTSRNRAATVTPAKQKEQEESEDEWVASIPGEPRSLRFSFSVATTSTKEPKAILAEIIRACKAKEIKFEVSAFVVKVMHQKVIAEIEVCKLPRLSVCGLKFKRSSGDSMAYKNLCAELVAEMHL